MILSPPELIAALKATVERVNALDTSVAQIGKLDVAQELGRFLVERKYLDVFSVDDGTGAVDTFSLAFFKFLTDSTSFAEKAVIEFQKVLNETPTFSEAHFMDFHKTLVDSAVATDLAEKAVWKGFSDAFSMTDDDTLTFGKGVTNTATFSDTDYNFAIGKTLADTVGATDDVDGSASILDDQEMQFVKITTDTTTIAESIAFSFTFAPFSDSASVIDSADVVPNKVVSDTTALTDAGSYRSQGYSDFTYFAEDFVGASGTF